MSLRIAQVTAEFAGLAQTGGLADAVSALAKGLAAAGHEVRLFLPLYGTLDERQLDLEPEPKLREVVVPFGERELTFSVSSLKPFDGALTLYLLDCPPAYGRRAIYDRAGDEHFRFALLARAALECCQRLGWSPQILHCHDWHAALLPLYLRRDYSWDRLLAPARSVLTVHNLAYQGFFPPPAVSDLGLEGPGVLTGAVSDGSDAVNFLATGLAHADWITTVSPTYAREIRDPEFGAGLESLLGHRADRLRGILNGVDYDVWDPSDDPALARSYSVADLSGKAVCRAELLAELDLLPGSAGPVFGVISRLAEQKGLELVLEVLPEIIRTQDARLAVLGSGDQELESSFRDLTSAFPGRVAFVDRFDAALSHRIEAGSDVFLMPSRFEPCGLNQMYSQRYGTPPVVHRVGGLADTVEQFDPRTGTGTGFLFSPFAAASFRGALEQALDVFRSPDSWRRLILNGMSGDFSWSRRVDAYVELYRQALAEEPFASGTSSGELD